MSRKIFLSLTLCTFLQVTARADYYPRDWNVDVRQYRFYLSLTDESDYIEGKALVSVFFKADVEKLFLDLVNMNADGKGMKVQSVKMNGMGIQYTHENNRLELSREGSPFHKGDFIEFEIEYKGIPADGLIISQNKYGDRTFFGDNWPDRARHWLPCVDHPSDKAKVDFIVHAPEIYQVVGNGILMEKSNVEDGFRLTHWREYAEISTKVMVIGAARFAVELSGMMRNIPVQAWVYPQNREEGFYDYGPAVKVLDYFDSHIGPYSYEKLANVQSKTRYGGMENASNIFYFENSVNGNGEREGLIAHEIAHQWFGNSATEKDWHHIWLSEGFATYFTHLYMEHSHGFDVLKERMARDRENIIAYYEKDKTPVVNTAIRKYNKLLTTNAYQKGGWILHMLRHEIGDHDFWQGIRNYYKKYQNGNALTVDFKVEIENASSKDLDKFFDQWIFGVGQPKLRINWTYDDDGHKLLVDIAQIQETTLFDFPLEIEAHFDNNRSTMFLARVDKVEGTFTFDCEQKPTSLVFDPNVQLLFTQVSENK